MHVIYGINVEFAYHAGMNYLMKYGQTETSRAGNVRVAPGPVTTIYTKPCERVLLNPDRDANPFFHLMEAMWMLAGRKDAAFLNRYVGDFGARFAEQDGSIHDAYGHRWRQHFGFDQINEIVKKLQTNRGDRQCVLQMWDAHSDLADIGGANDLLGDLKTRPCNTHVYFRAHPNNTLDMTLLCRSNDMIFGGYGANAVHFSFLLEYVATMAGLTVGTFYQVSNNFHAYEDVLKKVAPNGSFYLDQDKLHYYESDPPVALVSSPMHFDAELLHVVNILHDSPELNNPLRVILPFKNDFLSRTVIPMMHAHRQWKFGGRREIAFSMLGDVEASDWRRAGEEWMIRRMMKNDATVDFKEI